MPFFVSSEHFGYLLLFLRCVNRRNQHFLEFNTLRQDRGITVIATFDQQLQPIFTLGAFFQSNLEFGNKVCSAVGIESLPDVGSDAGSGTDQLIGQDGSPLFPLDFVTNLDDQLMQMISISQATDLP